MPTKTTTKHAAPKASASKAAKTAASAKSPTRSRSAVKPVRSSKAAQEESVAVAGETEGKVTPALRATPTEAAGTKPAPAAATKSAFAPITAKKAPAKATPPEPEPAPKAVVESVSLIEAHIPKPKRAASDEAVKRTFLPPISRIRATPVAPKPEREKIGRASCREEGAARG